MEQQTENSSLRHGMAYLRLQSTVQNRQWLRLMLDPVSGEGKGKTLPPRCVTPARSGVGADDGVPVAAVGVLPAVVPVPASGCIRQYVLHAAKQIQVMSGLRWRHGSML